MAELVNALRPQVEVQVRAFGHAVDEQDITGYPDPAELDERQRVR